MEMLQLTQLLSNLRGRFTTAATVHCSAQVLLENSVLNFELNVGFNQQFWTFWAKSTRSSSINLGLLKKNKKCANEISGRSPGALVHMKASRK